MPDSPLRVLIVDDEAPARRRLRDLLDDCTSALPLAIIGEAQHGREALELLQSAPADLVLTDIHMPDMDGVELARHVLKLPHPPVVIFTTAFHEHALPAVSETVPSVADASSCADPGCNAYEQPAGGGGWGPDAETCVTSNRTPPISTVPTRAAPAFASARIVTLPGPLPCAPCVTDSQSASVAAVHAQPAGP